MSVIKRFAFIADGEVFKTWAQYENESPATPVLHQTFRSNPTIVVVPDNLVDTIEKGDIWDGSTFRKP
jgi:hypothetical protein